MFNLFMKEYRDIVSFNNIKFVLFLLFDAGRDANFIVILVRQRNISSLNHFLSTQFECGVAVSRAVDRTVCWAMSQALS